ncbi:MAG TPA: pseudaminic acid synthase [Bacillota bacterium]|nr:pseudaminic acid synthase [Bacillota bacterium]HOL10510.1 pseudaminic acid synthase [Bacillota bacterium]HPO97838.1 pseudaminic acid synthase [Bacillota bacterium]
MKPIKIGQYLISRENPPFIVAEMSGNHNHSLERALAIVEAAAKAGAKAVKLQTYTADTMTLDLESSEFRIEDPKSLWYGYSLYRLYQQAYTPWEWHEAIFQRCHELGLVAFSTPFDETAVDFLEGLNVPCYKIASFENLDYPLLQKVAKTKKPIIVSTGMATVGELGETVDVLREAGAEEIILLKCTSTYPATPEDSNLLTIPHLRQLFDCEVGLSDHTLGIGVAVASVALGATVIEKHFTLSRAEGGVDAAFSMEPDELQQLVVEAERAWQSLGTVKYGPTENEKESLKFRRSLYVAADMRAGEVFTEQNLKAIRPGFGLPPKYYQLLLGKKVNRDLKKGTAVKWEYVG